MDRPDRTYRLRFGPAPDGRIRYRASRAGLHVIQTRGIGSIVLVDPAGTAVPPRLARYGMRTREALARADVYELEAGRTYVVELTSTGADAALFVEHLETFGSDAWAAACP